MLVAEQVVQLWRQLQAASHCTCGGIGRRYIAAWVHRLRLLRQIHALIVDFRRDILSN